MNALRIALLRSWIFFMWNMQQIIAYIRGRRSVFIPITDLCIIYNNDGLLVVDKSHELLINSNNSWFDCVTLQMQVWKLLFIYIVLRYFLLFLDLQILVLSICFGSFIGLMRQQAVLFASRIHKKWLVWWMFFSTYALLFIIFAG